MALADFFSINMPYGISRNDAGAWTAFNREYMPLGFNTTENSDFKRLDEGTSPIPVYTKYTGITNSVIQKLVAQGARVLQNDAGETVRVWLYGDGNVPTTGQKNFSDYIKKLQLLCKAEVKREVFRGRQ